jgi:hypothetical protein
MFLVTAALVVAALVAGVMFSDKIKVWLKVKSADAEATAERDAQAVLAKAKDDVKAKL